MAQRSGEYPDWDHHLREFLDTFYAADLDLPRQAAMIAAEPAMIGDRRADAFLGGVGEHLARRWGLPIPSWVRHEGRYPHEALFVPDVPGLRGYLLAVSPVSFRVRLIFTGPDPLQRARFPYRRGVVDIPMDYPQASAEGDVASGPLTPTG